VTKNLNSFVYYFAKFSVQHTQKNSENIATGKWQRFTIGIDNRLNIDHARMV